jgi:hypothetical protein
LGLSSGLFPSGFPTKTFYTPLFFPIRVTCPATFHNIIMAQPNYEQFHPVAWIDCSWLEPVYQIS